jgi:CMP-N,N'-diacetyllegionaminic acid synthase
MYKGQRILAVVPARGGSKGVLRKNIRPLAGDPLIIHTLRTAKTVNEIDLLVVSTDDNEIETISLSYEVDVIKRPKKLASDNATTESALLHVLDTLDQQGKIFDILIVLEPTSPLRSSNTIKKTIKKFVEKSFESILAVKESFENIGFIEDGCFRALRTDAPRRRQLRKPFFIESSTIYAVKTNYLRRAGTIVCDNWGAIIVPNEESFDINTEEDFNLIECFIKNKRRQVND